MNDKTKQTPGGESREVRQARLLSVTLSNDRIGSFSTLARNISERGLGGRSEIGLRIGERIAIVLPGHDEQAGIVRWVKGDRFGVRFDAPITLDRLRGANGARLVTVDDAPDRFEPLRHEVDSTYRVGFGSIRSESGTAASDWIG